MLRSKIHIDLPSAETDRRMNPLEWTRSLFGAEIDLKSGEEELTVSAVTLTQGIIKGFDKAGVTNAIAFLVDKNVVYQDVNDEKDDLHLIVEAAKATGVLLKPFDEMHMVLTHGERGIHFIFDVRVRNQVVLGEEEMTVAVSGRAKELRIRPGESATKYTARIKKVTADAEKVESWRLTFQDEIERIGRALGQTMTGSKVTVAPAVIEIIRPTKRQVARFRDLTFDDNVTPPTYRAVPTHQRKGAYADPFYYYYYDPYYDYTHYLLLDSMLHHHHWHTRDVSVVSPQGETLFQGDESLRHANDSWDVSSDDVSFAEEGGGLAIASSIPESTVPGSEDWGGSDLADSGGSDSGGSDSGGGFFSDFFGGGGDGGGDGGGGGGSSCSSCGSSCGGGCGGCGGCG